MNTSGIVSLTILVNDKEIMGICQVSAILIENAVNRIPYAEIHLADGSPSSGDFLISDSASFVPGNELIIKAGYNGDNTTLFSGIIIKHGIRITAPDGPRLVIECRDKAIRMTIGRKNDTFENQSDGEVICAILEKYQITGSCGDETPEMSQIIQYYVSDWDFMLTRADINGQIILVDGGEVSMEKPKTSAKALLTVEYGNTLISLDASIDARTQLSSVRCSAWDMKTQKVLEADGRHAHLSSAGNLTSKVLAAVTSPADYQLQSSAPLTKLNLQDWANASLVKSQLAKITGKARIKGNALLKPGSMLCLSGLGERFNGNIFVSSVSHTIKDGEWITDVQLGLSNDWYAESQVNLMAAPASSVIPGIKGLQIATVLQIQDDPDSEFRVLVRISLLPADSPGVWARMAYPYASASAGFFFYPEVNDEVVLNFLNEDPRFPVIIGSLYSSAKIPPFTPDENNTTKAIVTRKGLKIVFDDQNLVTSITTPKNNSIVLSEKEEKIIITDQNKNIITMSAAGVEISSCKDLKLSAPGDIILGADGNINLNAQQNLACKAVEFNLSATAKATIDTGLVELTASGTVTIKGAMVMIN